jgi:hypothetical protein
MVGVAVSVSVMVVVIEGVTTGVPVERVADDDGPTVGVISGEGLIVCVGVVDEVGSDVTVDCDVGVISGDGLIAWDGVEDGVGSGVVERVSVICAVVVTASEEVACGDAAMVAVPPASICAWLLAVGRTVISWMGVYSVWALETAPPP